MSSLQCLACWSSHWQFTSPDFLKGLKHLSVWCQIHSDNSWSCLVLHALGSNLGLGCFQNQCCTALLSNTVLHTKEKSGIILARWRSVHLLSIQLEKQKKTASIYSLPAAHQHVLAWFGSVDTNLTQASTLFTDSIDILRCQEETHNVLL